MRVTRTRTRAGRVSVGMGMGGGGVSGSVGGVVVVVVMWVWVVVLRVMLSAVVRVVVVPRPRGERATSVSVAGTKPTEHRGKTWERASMETAMVVMYLMLTARGGQRGAEITCWAGHPLLERRCSEWMRCLLTWMVWCTRVRGPFQMLLRAYEKWRCECRWDISPTTPPAVTARSRHTCVSWGWMSRPNTLSPHRRPPCGCWPNTLPHPRACLWSVGRESSPSWNGSDTSLSALPPSNQMPSCRGLHRRWGGVIWRRLRSRCAATKHPVGLESRGS